MAGLGFKEAKDILDKLKPTKAIYAPSNGEYIVIGDRYGDTEVHTGFLTFATAREFAVDLDDAYYTSVKVARVVARSEMKRTMVNV